MNIKRSTWFLIILGSLLIIDIILLINYLPKGIEVEVRANLTENYIMYKCQNLSMEDTSSCLVNQITPYYIYNRTDDRISLSFNELMVRGGDCKDWSELYERLGKKLGFNSKVVIIGVNDSSMHEIAIISNDDGYCILDQRDKYCTFFKSKLIKGRW